VLYQDEQQLLVLHQTGKISVRASRLYLPSGLVKD